MYKIKFYLPVDSLKLGPSARISLTDAQGRGFLIYETCRLEDSVTTEDRLLMTTATRMGLLYEVTYSNLRWIDVHDLEQ